MTATLTGMDFEFLERAAVVKVVARPPKPVETRFVLPLGKRAGVQGTAAVDIDTTAHGAYLLLLTQSDGRTREVPFTVLPPNPVISGLPVRVNQDDAIQQLRLQGSGLDRIEAISSEAGDIKGAAGESGWAGSIRLKPGVLGTTFAISLKVRGLEAPVTVPGAIRVFGPRPVITAVRKAVPGTLGLAIRADEMPAGTTVGLSLDVRQFHDSSANPIEGRPRVELGCKSGGLRKSLSLSPDEHVTGAELTVAGPVCCFSPSIPPSSVIPGAF